MPGKQYPLSVVIEAVDKLTAPMRRINQSINDTFRPIRRLNASLAGLARETGVTRLGASFSNLGGAIGSAWGQARGLMGTMTGLAAAGAGAGYAFKRFFIDPAAEYENLALSLNAIMGGADKAADALKFVDKLAYDTPFTLAEMGDSFRTLKAMGLDPMQGTLQAIADQVAKVGGKGYDLQEIASQLGQAFMKGKLNADDVKPLINRGIGVWDLLVKAAARAGKKVTVEQLMAMNTAGKLGRESVVQLIEQMGIESRGAALAAQKSWSGLVSNISDTWDRFARAVMNAGVFDYLKGHLQMVLDWVQRLQATGERDKLVARVSGQILTALTALWDFGQDLYAVLRTVGGWLMRVHDLFGSWKPLIIAVGLLIAGPFLAALLSVGTAVAGLGVSLGGMATTIGLMNPPLAAMAALLGVILLRSGGIAGVWDRLKIGANALLPGNPFQTSLSMTRGAAPNLPTPAIAGAAFPSRLGDFGSPAGARLGTPAAGGAPVSSVVRVPPAAGGSLHVQFGNAPAGMRVTQQRTQGVSTGVNYGSMMGVGG